MEWSTECLFHISVDKEPENSAPPLYFIKILVLSQGLIDHMMSVTVSLCSHRDSPDNEERRVCHLFVTGAIAASKLDRVGSIFIIHPHQVHLTELCS